MRTEATGTQMEAQIVMAIGLLWASALTSYADAL